MAAIMNATFLRMLKALQQNGNIKEKREALVYIASQAKKLEASDIIQEERYKDICRSVIEAFAKHEGALQNEALGAFNAIVREFQRHSLHLFESMIQTDKKTRLKIFKLLEIQDDNAISAAANDAQILNFFKHCLVNIQPSLMEWLTPTACVDNLQMLTKIEHQPLLEEEKLEEDINNYALALLRRLYRMASITFDQNVQKFDTLLMDKIIILAYMGHKRQRGPALKVLQQAILTNATARIRKDYPDLWTLYKDNLQCTYYKRMLLLVEAYDMDWTTQWNATIQFLGTDLHRGARLINNLLSVEEKAFKSTDPVIRRQAFLSWKLLIDNFALNHQELATARRIKLLCIPLNAKNSKTELIALTKLEVWWHLIIKLYKDIVKFVNPVITQFLNYCFGPLGDTPLLSSKFDVVASPGKRFFKTKVVAVDALSQLLVTKEDLIAVCSPMLEERLPHAISYEVFQECSKSVIHSIAEAILILGQLTDKEMKNRFQLSKTLWTSLMIYIRNVKLEAKDHLYRNVILVVTELANHIDKLMVRDMIFNVILSDINSITEKTEFHDNALPELVLKLLTSPTLNEILKYILDYDSNSNNQVTVIIKCLLERCVGPEFTYSSGVLGFLETIMANLKSLHDANKNKDSNELTYLKLWSMIAEILTKYIRNTEIDKNDNFKVMKSVLSFPFHTCVESLELIKYPVEVWKTIYKVVELHSDLITTVKPNEFLLDIASMMRNYLNTNRKCCTFIVNCLDALLSTLDYESLLTQDEIPSILLLIIDVVIISLIDAQNLNSEISLKALSAMLITIYGHNLQKIISYLHVCQPVIKLILSSQTTALFKEIANTWEYIVSIFKGLNRQLDYKLLSSYNEIIMLAINHPNPDIKSLTQSIFEIKNNLDSTTKCILDEMENPKKKSYSKSDSIMKKKIETVQAKEVHIAGSFLNKKSVTTKSVPCKSEKSAKKTSVLPEPDSQDYVYIKTDLKFDVNRLTEHQKEILKRKREDIPALYNDLSQSSSQNSQNLQQWFDIKAKHINEIDKTNNENNDSTIQKSVDNDANKENKVVKQIEISNAADTNASNSELEQTVEENIADTKRNEDSTKKVDSNEKQNTSKHANLSSHAASFNEKDILKTDEEKDTTMTIASVAKKLNFESKDEFPENKIPERQSSPSMLNGNKRRNRNSMTKLTSSLKSDENAETEKNSNTTVQRTLRVKTTQGKPDTNSKQKSSDDTNVKENSNENKKCIKRKHVSDESDKNNQRRKRKLFTCQSLDGSGESSRNSDIFSDIDMDSVSQRMKNEMSRLRINMVFDCPSINRRRIKYPDSDDEKETIVHGLRKYGTLKSTDTKSTEGSKRSPKSQEKNVKDVDNTEQGMFKRRGRRSKQESNKNDLDINKDKESKKSNDIIDKAELKNETDMAHTALIIPSSQTVQNVNKVQSEKSDKNNLKTNSDIKSMELTEPSKQSQDEIEDVVESSQVSNTDSKIDKKCNEKQCFIKINKMINFQTPIKTSDATVDKTYVSEFIPMNCDDNNVSNDADNDSCEKLNLVQSDSNMDTVENTNNIDKGSIKKTNNSNAKNLILEDQKIVDNSLSMKSSVITFSSSRNSRIFSKSKSFTGRAAHMLGLVTNQTRLEVMDNSSNVLEEESSTVSKKLKIKDIENEMPANKKALMVKEIDKISGSSGSRQEKIFNNMKSTDYSSSSMTHAFTTLNNDGEKLLFKQNKDTLDSLSTESFIDRDNEKNASPLREKDNLPILEWSSANPPSLTASPSASILKRHRSSLPEIDLESTPKRKRVSFADPPVSKEMGYEITTAESPQKANKYSTSRNLTLKKDSPIKLKQAKLKLIPFDTEKLISEDDIQDKNYVDEEKNESLTKISEAYSEIINEQTVDEEINIDKEVSNSSLEMNNIENINTNSMRLVDKLDLAQEIEITADVEAQTFTLCQPENSDNVLPVDGIEVSETQQDIFDGMDLKTDIANNNDQIQTTSVDSIKLNVTDDSVIVALPTKNDNTTNMEDTMDIENITGLNSTVNTEEIFNQKLIRTSTQATENIADQDTLPVTNSLFASLFTQNTQTQEALDNIDPEFMDSTQPIYPTLLSCMEPIDSIIEHLTYPLWKNNLSTYFANRNIHTISDFAQLSEREINRMPMKSKLKTEFVKKVLECFETACALQTESSNKKCSNEEEQLSIKMPDEALSVPIAVASDIEMKSIDNVSLSCSTPLTRPIENTFDSLPESCSSIENSKKTVSSDMDISLGPIVSSNTDLLASDISKKFKQLNAMISEPGTSIDNTNTLPISLLSSENITTTSQTLSSNTSFENSAIKDIPRSSSAYNELLITHSSIGTNTEIEMPLIQTSTKSVACQMTLAELLDEIDLNQVMDSAIKRSNPEAILLQYKVKMAHLKEGELLKETIRMLGLQDKQQVNDASLKAACRACGLNKVLLKLPDIFRHDKQFFDKILKLYSKKLNLVDWLSNLDSSLEKLQLKNAICETCTLSEIVEILSEKLKQEEQESVKKSMPELSSLNAMLRRLPMDVIISHTIANEEIIPASVVLDIALQNNSSGDIAQALKQSPIMARRVLDKLWTSQFMIAHIENNDISKENLLNIFKSTCSKLTAQELLTAFHEAMASKFDDINMKILNDKNENK